MMNSESFKAYVDIRNDSLLREIDCAKEFEVNLIDVNEDGIKEIAVQGRWSSYFCGMYSGCSFWLFKKNNSGYQMLLSFGDAFDYKLGKNKRNGFRDLVLRENGGNYGSSRYIYQFNGVKYQAKRCFQETYLYWDKMGIQQRGKKLNIYKDDCPKEEN